MLLASMIMIHDDDVDGKNDDDDDHDYDDDQDQHGGEWAEDVTSKCVAVVDMMDKNGNLNI